MENPVRTRDGTKASGASFAAPDSSTGENSFAFWNGDKYEGEYLATRNPLTIVRQGRGVYSTSDGQSYEGRWTKDYLEAAKDIAFPDKSRFAGTLENMALEGQGAYKFKENVEIEGYLMNNQFIGDLKLRDPTGHNWKTVNRNNENQVSFYPESPFWQSILDLQTPVEDLEGMEEYEA